MQSKFASVIHYNLLFYNEQVYYTRRYIGFISGTLAYVYDEHKRDKTAPNYGKILEKKTSVLLYPQTYNTYVFEDRVGSEFDDTIAKLCFAQAVKFIETNSASTEPETNAQVIVLQYG